MADPDLQIKGGRGGGGHPNPEISGGGGPVSIKFFWSENKGGPGTTGPCPGSAISFSIHEVKKANCVTDKGRERLLTAGNYVLPSYSTLGFIVT